MTQKDENSVGETVGFVYAGTGRESSGKMNISFRHIKQISILHLPRRVMPPRSVLMLQTR